MIHDITTRNDIERMVHEFYKDLLGNPQIQPVFEGLDFEAHIPKIVSFWSLILLDEEGYTSNVFEKHIHLPIQSQHFDIWLNSFSRTVDKLFKGEKAELAKQRATLISYTFKSKWEHLHP